MPTETSGIIPNVGMTEDVALSVRIDYSDSNPIYVGVAAPGSSTSNNVWRIKKVIYSGNNPISVTWADGNTKYDNIWDVRASLTYT